MQRREFFSTANRIAAMWAINSWFPPAMAWESRRQAALTAWTSDQPVFTLGVASGEPHADSIVLWTRLAPQPLRGDGGMPERAVPVIWELAEDERFTRGLRQGAAWALPEHAHSVHVEVGQLASARRYWYRFRTGGDTSAVGSTQTAPAPHAEVARLRLALASCQHYEHGYYAVHREIAQQDLDCVVFVGDYIYETTNRHHIQRPHLTPVPRDLTTFRQRYANYKLDPDLQAAHAAHPWILTWDDHEVENDYTGLHSGTNIPDQDFLRHRASAYKAYFEHQPISLRRMVAPIARIHDCYHWGDLATLWTLDTRQFRDDHPCMTEQEHGGRLAWGCSDLYKVQRSMLGAEQEQWLATSLASSGGVWKVIAQTSQVSPSTLRVPLAGTGVYTDGWDGYPIARAQLCKTFAEQGGRNVICLGGDVHRHVAARLRLDPVNERSPVIGSEFVCSSLTTVSTPEWLTDWMRRDHPDTLHLRSDERGYVLLDITPQRVLSEFRATAFPVSARAKLHTQARYIVQRNQPGPVLA